MKNLLILLVISLAISLKAIAQSTEITPGTVLPSMTTAQRTGVASPKNGMLVFDTNTQSYWYRQSGVWVELPKGGSTSNYWQLNGLGGNEINNTNSGGLWSANPVGLTIFTSDTSNPPTAPINGSGTRMMWIPSRSAFRAGTVIGGVSGNQSWDAANIGLYSTGFGVNAKASGFYSTAMGNQTTASAYSSTAMGYLTTASGQYSTTSGYTTTASGNSSTAMGNSTNALGLNSTAMGSSTTASGESSTAMGKSTTASGESSTAMGESTNASGIGSTAMGISTSASGTSSTAVGIVTIASGEYSTAIGSLTIAEGYNSTAIGGSTKASGEHSTAMGYNTKATGDHSTAMGLLTTASGDYSTAMGYLTSASANYATAMGNITTASGESSTAMGSKVNTNYQTGTFLIGDSDPLIKGSLDAGVPDQFAARFRNGYYLLTSGSGSTGRVGMFAGPGANSWSQISDSTKKENFVAAQGENVLKSVAAMRVGTWNYIGQDAKTFRHWGVMAQDFYHHFGTDKYGTIGSDTLIATADFDGVAFAAIKALELRTRELQEDNEKLTKEVAVLTAKDEKLQKELTAKDEKYLQLFADLKEEIKALKSTSRSEVLTAKTEE